MTVNQAILKRFYKNKKSTEPNMMSVIITGRISAMKSEIQQETVKSERMEKVLEFLDEYGFEVEEMSRRTNANPLLINLMQAGF